MKFSNLSMLALTLLATVSVSAQTLKLDAGVNTIEGINVSKTGTLTVDNQAYKLTTVGSGLRAKKVLVAKVKVYVAQLLVASPEKFVKTDAGALASLDASQAVAIQLTFLRAVDAATVQVSFRDGLTANGVNIDSPAIAAFLKAVADGGDAANQKSMTIALVKNQDGSESVVYEDTAGKATVVNGNRGLTEQIMSPWLGKSADSGLSELKAQLLK